jgi:hypothetical protein
MKLSLKVVAVGAIVFSPMLAPLAGGGATPNGHDLLVAALKDASKNSSYEEFGAFRASGSPSSMTVLVTKTGQETIDNEQETGTVFLVEPTDAHRLFFRATTVHALLLFLSVHAPRASLVNRWLYLDPSDQRYKTWASSGPRTVATQFVIGPRTFGSSAKYEGVTTLKGTRVVKLGVTSSWMSPTNALIPMVLYVTDTHQPLPFAVVGKLGDIPAPVTSYFSRWSAVPPIRIPRSNEVLPQ